jgi:hypothetical protein
MQTLLNLLAAIARVLAEQGGSFNPDQTPAAS